MTVFLDAVSPETATLFFVLLTTAATADNRSGGGRQRHHGQTWADLQQDGRVLHAHHGAGDGGAGSVIVCAFSRAPAPLSEWASDTEWRLRRLDLSVAERDSMGDYRNIEWACESIVASVSTGGAPASSVE